MLLTCRLIPAPELQARFGLINELVPTASKVLPAAIAWAARIVSNSPDSVQATKRGLLDAQENAAMDGSVEIHMRGEDSLRVYRDGSGNLREGLRAFKEKRDPVWVSPATRL